MAKSTQDLLSPNYSPSSAPDTTGKRPGVRRLNNIPLFIVGAIVLGFALIIALVAATKGQQSNNNAEMKNNNENSRKQAEALLNEFPQGGVVTAQASMPTMASAPSSLPEETASAPTLPASAPLSLPAVPDMAMTPTTDQEAEQIRQAKAQMFEAALRAPTSVNAVAPTSAGSAGMYSVSSNGITPSRSEMLAEISTVQQMAANAGSSDAANVYAQQLASMGQGGSTPSSGGGADGTPNLATPPSPEANVGQATVTGESKWRLNTQVVNPNTYMIRTGSVLPATLISGVNSDLPGTVQAQISQNVYDSPTGRHLLIPQGSRLLGTYSSGLEFGQRRLFIAWNRIIFPDGKAIDIGAMPGTSGTGYAGFRDKVNNHYGRIWGNALMLSIVGAGISYSTDRNDNNENNESTVKGTLSESLGQTFGQAVSQSIQKNMNISPTLEIRPGYRFNVILTKDIDFSKPYRSFDY